MPQPRSDKGGVRMDDYLKLISTFLDAVALLMALVFMVSILKRAGQRRLGSPVFLGVLFSCVLVMSMADPIDLGPAGIFDMRGLLIGTAAALFGPVVGLMTLATGLGMRGYIGGPGMIPGFFGMLFAYGAGIAWLYLVRPLDFATWKKSIVLGCMITFQLMGIFWAPQEIRIALLGDLLPYTLVSNVAGALLINYLISGEMSFLSEAQSSKIDATTDHLTGLLNRRGLELVYPQLATPVEEKRGRALLYFDIDHFKSINDTHGHAVGDDVLRYVTQEVANNLRPNDIFARLGGDEFAIVLSNIDELEAHRIAKRCRAVVDGNGFENAGDSLEVSISVGAVWMLEHTEIDRIIDEADKALYAAKSEGRNRVIFRSNFDRIRHPGLVVPA